MTIKEIILSLLDQAVDREDFADPEDPEDIFTQDAWALREAARLLGGMEPPEVPLTVEELRKMDGEPVWCVSTRGECRWGIVHVYGDSNDEFECYTTGYGRIDGWSYGMDGKYGECGWLAYRRRPMENLKGADYNEQNCG